MSTKDCVYYYDNGLAIATCSTASKGPDNSRQLQSSYRPFLSDAFLCREAVYYMEYVWSRQHFHSRSDVPWQLVLRQLQSFTGLVYKTAAGLWQPSHLTMYNIALSRTRALMYRAVWTGEAYKGKDTLLTTTFECRASNMRPSSTPISP